MQWTTFSLPLTAAAQLPPCLFLSPLALTGSSRVLRRPMLPNRVRQFSGYAEGDCRRRLAI
jgi:hypothetical protein